MVLAPIKYIGSKNNMADDIIAHFPRHENYVEVFGGSAAILMAKPRSMLEVYNDVNGDLVCLFNVLRDEAQAKRLNELLDLTPYSRLEWRLARDKLRYKTYGSDAVERARCVFVVYNQSMGGSIGVEYKRGGWGNHYTSDGDILGTYFSRVDSIHAMSARLRNVLIEWMDFEELIKRYDKPSTLFYLDPPYKQETRPNSPDAYSFDNGGEDMHNRMEQALLKIQGNAVVSGYGLNSYNELVEAGWNVHTIEVVSTVNKNKKAKRTEVLWLSPGCQYQPQMKLDLLTPAMNAV